MTDVDSEAVLAPANELKIFVGNLPYTTANDDLARLFRQFGQVIGAKVVMDRDTGGKPPT